jgi:polysaccharide export outer membrane protein
MHAPKCKPLSDQISDLCLRAGRLFTLFLVVSIVPLAKMDFSAKASEEAGGDRPGQASVKQALVKADESEAGSAASAPAPDNALGDYRLAPGDRLTIDVFDQPQLSGDFIIDGGGEVLLPLAGSARIVGLTLAGARELIQKQFADGVLVRPVVSVRIKEFRPIFVTGQVRKAGSYPFMFGESVKAAIATAGGIGEAIEQPLNVTVSDLVTAEERVLQLEADRASLLVRKARLETQRDERENFMMPLFVGLNTRNVDFERIYSSENDIFLRSEQTYQDQLAALQKQRPSIEAEIKAVTEQIAKQNERLDIVNSRLADLEPLFRKGLLRKEILQNQQIEKTLVQSQVSNLEAQVAHLRRDKGELDVKLGDVKATYMRQVLVELQATTQRLREIQTTSGSARKLRDLKAEAASRVTGEEDYVILISRLEQGRLVNFDATNETTLLPGDVVDVRRNGPDTATEAVTEAVRDLSRSPTSAVAEGSESPLFDQNASYPAAAK